VPFHLAIVLCVIRITASSFVPLTNGTFLHLSYFSVRLVVFSVRLVVFSVRLVVFSVRLVVFSVRLVVFSVRLVVFLVSDNLVKVVKIYLINVIYLELY
jgi:hypothetical protein